MYYDTGTLTKNSTIETIKIKIDPFSSINYRTIHLSKILQKVNKNMAKKKKWGKMGAPKSAKRKRWMAKIRKKR